MPDLRAEPAVVSNPVLVMGTSPDYVVKIYDSYRKPILFIMDTRFKGHPLLNRIDKTLLVFCPLDHFQRTLSAVEDRLNGLSARPRGVACFDCESLLLAGRVAEYFQKPFPPTAAIARARNKFESRRLWREAGITTPRAITAANLKHTLSFYRTVNRPIILKPLSGSGSELVFKCCNETEIEEAVRTMQEQLLKRRSNPFFTDIRFQTELDPCQTWIVEEFIRGPEYSCDFILDQGRASLVRETGKLRMPQQTFGSVLAYTCPPLYPPRFSYENLCETLEKAARALGFSRGYFMADFIVKNGRTVIIEMTPRPGGDSIPDLIKAASGYDILGGYLDFMAENITPGQSDPPAEIKTHAGVNFYADRSGIISRLDYARILSDPMVKNLILKKQLGDRIVLPPDNYDDRLLGYCIINLNASQMPLSQYRSFQKRLEVSIIN